MRRTERAAFSLVEAVIALAVASFALMTIFALLPVGLMANHMSTEELHASNLLSVLSQDLRGTDPRLHGGKSLLFDLPLPYRLANGRVLLDAPPPATGADASLPAGCSIGLDRSEKPVALTGVPRPPYQLTVLYAVAAAAAAPLQARLVVNWPALDASARISDLTDPAKVKGYLEAYVTYPAP